MDSRLKSSKEFDRRMRESLFFRTKVFLRNLYSSIYYSYIFSRLRDFKNSMRNDFEYRAEIICKLIFIGYPIILTILYAYLVPIHMFPKLFEGLGVWVNHYQFLMFNIGSCLTAYVYRLFGDNSNKVKIIFGLIYLIVCFIYVFFTFQDALYAFFNYKALDWNTFNSITEENINQIDINAVEEEADDSSKKYRFFKDLTLKEQLVIITFSLTVSAIYFYFDPDVEIPAKIIRYLLSKKES